MPPLHGPHMVPEAWRVIRFAISRAKLLLPSNVTSSTRATVSLNTVRTYVQKPIAIHPNALLKQSRVSHFHKDGSRGYSSVSKFPTKNSGPRYDRSSFPSSRTSSAIAQKGVSPFASTLRPNLTGGTLSRSAGGYSLGGAGKARQFSHTSGCQAQVIQNVSAGIRAFLINGSKARYDGIDSANGEKRWKTITKAQHSVHQNWETANTHSSPIPKGTSLEFHLSPTITALLPASSLSPTSTLPTANTASSPPYTLNTPSLLQSLSSDFARALRDLSLITHDLTKLARFGDLPLSLTHTPHGPILSVRFPGCDAAAVSALCDEAGIRRGSIVEDPAWAESKSRDVEMALLFPFAPADGSDAGQDEEEMGRFFGRRELSSTQQQALREGERQSKTRSFSTMSLGLEELSPSLGSELSTLHFDDLPTPSQQSDDPEDALNEIYDGEEASSSPSSPSSQTMSSRDFEGVEGIYRFLSAIDDARSRPLR